MWKSFLYAVGLVLALGSSIPAQSSPDEIQRLRELLGLESGKDLAIASSPKLPAGSRSLRIFLATGSDKRIRNYYARQIKQWNRYKDSYLATLELVQDINRADVILAKYKLNEKAETSKSSLTVYEQIYDPTTRTTTPRPVIGTVYSRSVRVNGYILRRVGTEIEILRQGVFTDTTSEGSRLHDGLWIAFLELLSAP